MLSEESVDSPARLSADRVWIIDPLDGTREYGMPGRDDWAVHVALWTRGAGITAAAVAQPSSTTVYTSDTGTARGDPPNDPLVFLVSDSRPPAFAAPVAEPFGATLRPWGRPARRRWPCCAATPTPTCTPAASGSGTPPRRSASRSRPGCTRSRVDGSPLVYNSAHPYLPDLLICRAELGEQLVAAIGSHS